MTRRRWVAWAMVIVGLAGFSMHGWAQSDPVYLGEISGPLATLSGVGELVQPGELDWFFFDLSDDATIHLRIDGEGGGQGLRVLVFDDSETFIDRIESRELVLALSAGSYRVRVDSVASDVQHYVLTLYNGVESESNDGLLEANDLGDIAALTMLSASLIPVGDADFFTFEIPSGGLPDGASAVRIETSGPSSGDTVLVLYRYDETSERFLPIAADDDSGDEYWSRLLVRPSGGERYALRVEETTFPLTGIREYSLRIEPVVLALDQEPNNTSATASLLNATAAGSTAWGAEGLLESESDIDFYLLKIPDAALIQIDTRPQAGLGDFDTYLTLYRSNGDRIAENDDSGDSGWSRIAESLEPGEYYVTVETSAYQVGIVPYRLEAVARTVRTVVESEPNDEETDAQLLEWTGSDALVVAATIGRNADTDSFRLVLEDEVTLACETGPQAGTDDNYDTTLSIYDEDLWEVAYNDDADGTWSRIVTTLAPGTYYIVVESYFGDEAFAYTLLLTGQ